MFSVVGDDINVPPLEGGEDEEEKKPRRGRWTIEEITGLVEFPFEVLGDIRGTFWRLTEKEKLWIKATVKKAVDKIPLKLLEIISWVGFPLVLAAITGKRIKREWDMMKSGETHQDRTTRDMEKDTEPPQPVKASRGF